MGVKQKYILTVGVENTDDIDPMEELLQEILLDLYDAGGVESIRVTNQDSSIVDEDVKELIDILDTLESRDVMRSIEVAREMEDQDE